MTAGEISAPEVRRDIDERSNTLCEAGSLVYETVLLTSGGIDCPSSSAAGWSRSAAATFAWR
jgi:hypothetical protein